MEVPEDLAGRKVECPSCGDVNLVPVRIAEPPVRPVAKAPGPAPGPEAEPERLVLKVRPAMLRSRPPWAALVLLLLILGVGGVIYAGFIRPRNDLLAVSVIAALIGAAVLLVWKVLSLTASLEVTNKRSIATRGLLSRATSEVLHEDIRNVQITQSFWQRVWRVGRIGISSAGQEEVEIIVDNVPSPDRIRRLIDGFRTI